MLKMWRGGYDEDWERRKEYLIRALFEDIPILSPVPEEDSERECSPHASTYSHNAYRPTNDERRAWSPLPPLIVEREPDKHDEPEEYYKILERKMRRIYKKLFIENRSLNSLSLNSSMDDYETGDSNGEVSSGQTANKTFVGEEPEEADESPYIHLTEKERQTHKSIGNGNEDTMETMCSSDRTLESNKSNNDNFNETNESHSDVESRTFSENGISRYLVAVDKDQAMRITRQNEGLVTSSSSSVASDPGGYYQQVTFQAEVHTETLDVGKEMSMVYEERDFEGLEERQNSKELVNLEDNRVSDLPIPENIRPAPQYLRYSEEIEVMRSPRDPCIRTSYGNLQEQSYRESSGNLTPTLSIHLQENRPTFTVLRDRSNSTTTEQSTDDFNRNLQSSTPKKDKKRRCDVESIFSYTYSSNSSPKKRRYENAGVQVNKTSEWTSLRDNFFRGTPKIFRLCSCKNHYCVC